MVIKVYCSLISCSQEVKKNQQRALMILESKNIPFTTIDITDPGSEDSKDYMNENARPKGDNKVPQTPQIFNEAEYCGDFEELDMANETDTLGEFLKLTGEEKKAIKIGITGILPEERAKAKQQSENPQLINGVSASREDKGQEIADEDAIIEDTAAPVESATEDIWGDRMDTDAQDGEVGREVVENEEVAEGEAAEDQDYFAADKGEEAEVTEEAAKTGADDDAAEVDNMASGEEKPTSEQMEVEAEA